MHDDERITTAAFHAAEGVGDWRVVATGPQAVFLADSFAHAASLVAAVAEAAERHGVRPDVDLRPEAAVVSVPHPDFEGIPAGAAPFAAAVSSAGAALGLRAEPALVQSIQLYVAQHSEADVRAFFLAALGYEPFGDADAVDPLRRGPQLAVNPITGDAAGRGRTHLDVFVPADRWRARVEAAAEAGGRIADEAQAPAWVTLASPDNHGVDIAGWPDARD
ncbi:hypothetical protein OVA14_05645 [Agrococcus sp. SL85]|uniref:VOC family protein n=1 Tax=Agrococcus sp. SL85 TaxID=2995141 RepID=UPI00226C9CB8|nr:VOC family protein [Agrococcus sp. SL85]WAC67223.1 hypothetical protein OVA14_05645 [Agrococcus sp. SL85]